MTLHFLKKKSLKFFSKKIRWFQKYPFQFFRNWHINDRSSWELYAFSLRTFCDFPRFSESLGNLDSRNFSCFFHNLRITNFFFFENNLRTSEELTIKFFVWFLMLTFFNVHGWLLWFVRQRVSLTLAAGFFPTILQSHVLFFRIVLENVSDCNS